MIAIKKISLIIILLLFILNTTYSNTIKNNTLPSDSTHNYLKITKRNNTKVFAVRVGEKITIHAKKLAFKGRIKAITNDKIYIDNFPPIYINDITKVRLKTTGFVILGGGLMIWGGIYVLQGVVLMTVPGLFIPAAVIMGMGAGLAYWGYDITKGKKLKFRTWKFESNISTITDIEFIDD